MAALARAILSNPALKTNFRLLRQTCVTYSTKNQNKNDEEIDLDKPIRYSTSPAATWKAEASFTGRENPDFTPWYEPYVVVFSVGIFLLYFCVLREESDVDREFDVSLFDRVEGLEEIQLVNIIKYYETNNPNYDVKPFEKRLAEIRALKNVA